MSVGLHDTGAKYLLVWSRRPAKSAHGSIVCSPTLDPACQDWARKQFSLLTNPQTPPAVLQLYSTYKNNELTWTAVVKSGNQYYLDTGIQPEGNLKYKGEVRKAKGGKLAPACWLDSPVLSLSLRPRPGLLGSAHTSHYASLCAWQLLCSCCARALAELFSPACGCFCPS